MKSKIKLFSALVVYQFKQSFYGFFFRNVFHYTLFLLVERYLATTGTHISEVSISHLSRAIYDTTHDAYLQSFHMTRRRLDAGNGGTEVI